MNVRIGIGQDLGLRNLVKMTWVRGGWIWGSRFKTHLRLQVLGELRVEV